MRPIGLPASGQGSPLCFDDPTRMRKCGQLDIRDYLSVRFACRSGERGYPRVLVEKADETNRPHALGLRLGAGLAATSITAHLRSSAELRVLIGPQLYTRIFLHAHGTPVLLRSGFAACRNAANYVKAQDPPLDYS